MFKHFRLLAPALFLAGCSMMPGAAGAPTHAERTSTNLILVYSLKDGVTPADFENWVRTTDYPSMRGIKRRSSRYAVSSSKRSPKRAWMRSRSSWNSTSLMAMGEAVGCMAI